MNTYNISGKVIEVGDIQEFSSGFTKRTVIIDTGDEKFPSPIPVTLKKDKCQLADGIAEGDVVVAKISIDGRRWEGPNGVRYFTDLTGWDIQVTAKAATAASPSAAANKDDKWGNAREVVCRVYDIPATDIAAINAKLGEKAKTYIPGKSARDFTSEDVALLCNKMNEEACAAAAIDDLPF